MFTLKLYMTILVHSTLEYGSGADRKSQHCTRAVTKIYTVISPDYIDGILQNLRDFDHRDIIPWRLYSRATWLILLNAVDKEISFKSCFEKI